MPITEGLPLLKLGYRTLAKVCCGKKTGTFIGGHTCFKASCPRDLFVRCDCPECSGLGDVTAEADGCGGRLLTLCMFERHGGKGASKKPLGSIKVVPEGGGDHKSLGPWLDSKSRELGERVVGRRIEVFWPFEGSGSWFAGVISSFDNIKGCHRINYDDGSCEHLKLFAELHRLLPEGPAAQQPPSGPVSSQEPQQEASSSGSEGSESSEDGSQAQSDSSDGLEVLPVETPQQQQGRAVGVANKEDSNGGEDEEGGTGNGDVGDTGEGEEAAAQGQDGLEADGADLAGDGNAAPGAPGTPAAAAAAAGAPDFLRQYAQALVAARAAEQQAQQAVTALAAEVASLESRVAAAREAEAQVQLVAEEAEGEARRAQQALGIAQAELDTAAAARCKAAEAAEAGAVRLATLRRQNTARHKALQRRRGELLRAEGAGRDLEGDAERLGAKRRRLDGEIAALQGRVEAVERLLVDGVLIQRLQELQAVVEQGAGASATPAETSSGAGDEAAA